MSEPLESAPAEKVLERTPSRAASLRARIALALGAIAFALLAGEVLCRLLPEPQSPFEPAYVDDPVLGSRPKPGFTRGTVRITSLGFRDDDEIPVEKPKGEVRVLFLGDSFLYAAGVTWKDVVTERLEAALNEGRSAPVVRVINTGCPGYGTDRHRALLESYGLPLSPDVVVLGFFVGNDVMEAITPERWVVRGDHSLAIEKREAALRKRMLESSALWRRIAATKLYQSIAHPRKQKKLEARGGETLDDDRYYEIEQLRLEQWRKDAWTRPPLEEGWRRVAAELERIRDVARKGGAEVVVALFPDEVQVDAKLREEVVHRSSPSIELQDYELDQPQTAVRAICAKLSVPCVDLLPAFREKGAQGGLYRPSDTHWNEAGHALAASLIAPLVKPLVAKRAGK